MVKKGSEKIVEKIRKYLGLWAIATAAATAACIFAAPVQASTLTVEGITYSLTDQVVNSTTDQFTLTITNINGPSDTRKPGWRWAGVIGPDAPLPQ